MAEPNNQQASMYGRSAMAEDNNLQSGQVDDDGDDVAAGEESIENVQIRFDDSGGCMTVEAPAVMNGVQDGSSSVLYVPGGVSDYAPVAENGGSDQLTLSFQGEVYVFDAVSPDKVMAFLIGELVIQLRKVCIFLVFGFV